MITISHTSEYNEARGKGGHLTNVRWSDEIHIVMCWSAGDSQYPQPQAQTGSETLPKDHARLTPATQKGSSDCH